jgi:hypothetical protein
VITSPARVIALGRDGAVGLYVPGAGATVSEARTIRALERGRVENAVLGGQAPGKPRIELEREPGRAGIRPVGPWIYLAVPQGGVEPNTRRYPIAIVAPGFHGILTSSSTRIPGLVAVSDVAEAAESLTHGDAGPIHDQAGTAGDLAALDRRLTRAHDYRTGALGIAVGLLAGLGGAAYLLRSRLLARAAVVFGAAAMIASLIVAASGIEHVTPGLLALAGTALALTAVGAFLPLEPVVLSALTALLLVLALDTSVNSFGPLGPHPETGTRFYGLSNLEETLLFAPVLAAAAGVWFLPVAALALLTIGWSHAGADGGGLLVFAVAFAVLWLRQRSLPLTVRRLALVGVGAVVLGLVVVGVDAALGGSSHVTHAVGSGSVFDDLWERWRLSWKVVTSFWYKAVLFLAGFVGLGWLATRRPRVPTVDAAIAATLVSLVVNDTPVDVLGIGALGGLALLAWERTRAAVDSRPDAPAAARPAAPRARRRRLRKQGHDQTVA